MYIHTHIYLYIYISVKSVFINKEQTSKEISEKQKTNINLLSEATMATTIDVVVEELCSSTVPSTPIIRPANGFVTTLFDENVSPEHEK